MSHRGVVSDHSPVCSDVVYGSRSVLVVAARTGWSTFGRWHGGGTDPRSGRVVQVSGPISCVLRHLSHEAADLPKRGSVAGLGCQIPVVATSRCMIRR
jgi:hypothetical protein